jgi:uncharacterized membrane protein (UPF0127 family)
VKKAHRSSTKFIPIVIKIATVVLLCKIIVLVFLYFKPNSTVSEPTTCKEPRTIIELKGAKLCASVASDDTTRIRGLSGTASLPSNDAMLFKFSQNDFHGIWMKDMNFAINIYWLNENKQIIDAKLSASPASFPEIYKPSQPAKYVLETNTSIDIKKGEQLNF